MYFRKFILLFSFILGAATASANEGGGEAPPANENYSGKQDQQWEAVQNELVALKAKVDQQTNLVQLLIQEKNHLKGQELTQKIEDTKREHQKYEQLVFDYNKKNDEFMTRYPERGLKEKRVYKRVKIKSLDSFEDDVTLRGRMNKLHKKVLNQYPKALQKSENNNESKSPSSKKEKPSEDVTDSIQYKK